MKNKKKHAYAKSRKKLQNRVVITLSSIAQKSFLILHADKKSPHLAIWRLKCGLLIFPFNFLKNCLDPV